jgi:hypothetical protein
MLSELRQTVPLVWVLLYVVTFSATEISNLAETQFRQADPSCPLVNPDFNSLEYSASLCTVQELSWIPGRMSSLSAEQKQKIRFCTKLGEKSPTLKPMLNFCQNV